MPIRSNPVKEKLVAGGEAYGTMIFEFLSPGLPQIAANSGADFLFYDMEHSGFDFEQIKMQCALCRGLGVVPMVRPPAKQYQFAARLLDIGAMGLLYQMVETPEEAEDLVRWTRYPPRGDRGAIFGGAHDDYLTTDMAEAARQAEDRTMVTVLIETAKGLENVDEILSVEGVDAAHLGHADLSLSLGIPGEMQHPRLQDGIDRIAEACRKHGKTAATLAANAAWGEDLKARGYRMIGWSFDMGIMQDGLTAGIETLRQGAN